MAIQNSKPARNKKGKTEQSNSDSLRWALGLFLFFLGIYMLASSLFYLGNWEADHSVLYSVGSDNPRFDDQVENPCGKAGAWLAELFMGRSFGLFGVVIPIIVISLGLRIIRRKPLLVNHFFLSACLVLLLGSVTLGYLFGKKWAMFGTGWGGAYGIELADLLQGVIGGVGTLISLLAAWILVGVFINRNVINMVNSAGSAVVGRGEKWVGALRRKGGEAETEHVPAKESEYPEASQGAAPASESWGPAPLTDSATEPFAPVVGEYLPPVETPVQEPRNIEMQPEDEDLIEVRPGNMDQMEAELQCMEHSGRRSWQPMEPQPLAGEDPFIELPNEEPDSSHSTTTIPPVGEQSFSGFDAGSVEDPFVELHDPKSNSENAAETFVSDPTVPSGVQDNQPKPMEESGVVVTFEKNDLQTLDEKEIDNTLYDPLKDLVYYAKPSPGLLENYPSDSQVTEKEIFEKKSRIEETLKNFDIPIKSIHATSGPTVTLYEIRQAEGVRISKIQGLENDIAQSIEARGIRIIAPIPGKGTIGIEVPNEHPQIVSMYSSICSPEFQSAKMQLPVVIGRTIQNKNFVFDLAKAPHLLVAGATGQGKSVGLNAIITSLLYTKHPAELKFVMIDPKMVEFSLYAGLEKHFLAKMESEEEAIITDPKKAVYTLHALEQEMEERLGLCKKAGAKNIVEYNEKFVNRRLPPPKGHRFLPYIVVVIDEFADLIMTAKEVERPVMRLAQKARAVGIHLIIATQRPDVRVITGGIKANFPARIAFRVMQMVDSRTIIDQPGAQTLIGRGDMLFTNGGELTRVQCALVETREVERIVEYISHQQGYPDAYPLPDYAPEGSDGGGMGLGSEAGESGRAIKYDALFAEIARTAVEQGSISVSMIQRNYEVGFNRAGRIMQQLQQCGIVGPQMGAKPRDILFHDLPSLEAKLQDLGVF